MKNYFDLLSSDRRSLRTVIYLLVAALALGLGMSLASTAHGAAAYQAQGRIAGIATVGEAGAAGVTVELRQRTNSGAESLLATATTDENGQYAFANQPSAPGDAFYYIRFQGGNGTLASWNTFPIIYLTGTDFTVPTVDLADVALVEPGAGSTVAPGSKIRWKARRAGEAYRLYIYAEGSDKPVVDSGSLGSGTEYTLGDGGLAEGQYEAIVQVRDAVVGFGQSRARFQFAIGKATPPTEQPEPEGGPTLPALPPTATAEQQITIPTTQPQPEATAPQAEENSQPQQSQQPTPTTPAPAPQQGTPQLKLRLTADKTALEKGDSLTYVVEVRNEGDGPATDVTVTDLLPAGLSVDLSQMRNTHGSVAVEGNKVTARVAELAPNTTAQVEFTVMVGNETAAAISNQANAVHQQGAGPVLSNAFIVQVTERAGVAQPAPTEAAQPAPTVAPPAQPAESSQAATPVQSQPQSPAGSSAGNAPGGSSNQAAATKTAEKAKRSAAIPQTGGSFPLVLAIGLLVVALLARYLRGSRTRRI